MSKNYMHYDETRQVMYQLSTPYVPDVDVLQSCGDDGGAIKPVAQGRRRSDDTKSLHRLVAEVCFHHVHFMLVAEASLDR